MGIFSPAITSSQAARLYGISYVLEPSGVSGPKGSVSTEGWVTRTYIAYRVRELPHWSRCDEMVVTRQIRFWLTRQSGSSEPQHLEDGHEHFYSKCPPPETPQRARLARNH